MNLTCPDCGAILSPSKIEEWKYVCTGCNAVFEAQQLKNDLDKKHRKLIKKKECLCGSKMDFHSRLGKWVCPKKHSLERKLRYLQ